MSSVLQEARDLTIEREKEEKERNRTTEEKKNRKKMKKVNLSHFH